MATLYQTTGITLGWRDHREADRWYSVFTRDRGKIEFRARGAHKPLAKLSPHLEMVAEVDLMLVNGRYYETVAGVERKRAFSSLYQDLHKLMLAQNALHLVDMGTRPFQEDEDLYNALCSWLYFLDETGEVSPERSGFLLGGFALKLMDHTGYRPELWHCLSCKRDINPGCYRWHALKGGVVCDRCQIREKERWFSARAMSDETMKLLRFALKEPFGNQTKPYLAGAVLEEFHEAVESLIVAHFPLIPANSLREASLFKTVAKTRDSATMAT